jgi:RNA polymerase-binding transcription factor
VSPGQRLADERARTTQRLARLRAEHAGFVAASKDSNADDEHDPEGATIAFERSQVATLLREGEDRLADIDAALGRLAAGHYGTCEGCGSPIPEGRLEARPMTRHCVGCAA